jgi:hypothetical protein
MAELPEKIRNSFRWFILAKAHLKAYAAVRQTEKQLLKEFKEGVKQVVDYLKVFLDANPGFIYDSEIGAIKAGYKKNKIPKVDILESVVVMKNALSRMNGKTVTARDLASLEELISNTLHEKAPAPDDAFTRMQVKYSRNKKKHAEVNVEMTARNFNAKLLELLAMRPDVDGDAEIGGDDAEADEIASHSERSAEEEEEDEEDKKFIADEAEIEAEEKEAVAAESDEEEKEEKQIEGDAKVIIVADLPPRLSMKEERRQSRAERRAKVGQKRKSPSAAASKKSKAGGPLRKKITVKRV